MSCVARCLRRPSERIVPCLVPVLLARRAGVHALGGDRFRRISRVQPGLPKPRARRRRQARLGRAAASQRPARAIRAMAARLEIGAGDVVADIGAGKGGDTWVFAEIVGPSGVVYSEEITENQVKSLRGGGREAEADASPPRPGTRRQSRAPAGERRFGVHAVGVPSLLQAARDAAGDLAGAEAGRLFRRGGPPARHAARLGAPRAAREQALLAGRNDGRARSPRRRISLCRLRRRTVRIQGQSVRADLPASGEPVRTRPRPRSFPAAGGQRSFRNAPAPRQTVSASGD